MEYLAGKGIVRHRTGEPGRDDAWLLQHDSLCRGVLAAERYANRRRALLQEGAIRWRESAGLGQRWRALLSPWEQVRLFFSRLFGKLRYGPEGRFALLSTLRFLPYLLLLLGIWGASLEYRRLEDQQEAIRIFTLLASNSGESEQLSAFASTSPRVRWQVFELAFADAKHAEMAEPLLPMLLRLELGLDPQGNLRRRLWTRYQPSRLGGSTGPQNRESCPRLLERGPREPGRCPRPWPSISARRFCIMPMPTLT